MQNNQLNWLSFSDKKPENFNTLSTQNLDHIKQSTFNIIEPEKDKKTSNTDKKQNDIDYILKKTNWLYIGWNIYFKKIERYPALHLSALKLIDNWVQIYEFEYIKKINDNILMYDISWDFVILNPKNKKNIYQSNEWESLQKDDFWEVLLPITIKKPYWFDWENITSQINTNTWKEKFDQYNDKYEVVNPKYWNINKILLKLFKWKLLLPKFSSIEEFLNSPFFWDVVSVAMEENKEKEQYRRKTFYECILLDDFQNIYKEGWNIFEDKADNIKHNISFRLNKNFKLEEIKQLISKKLDSNKRKITN